MPTQNYNQYNINSNDTNLQQQQILQQQQQLNLQNSQQFQNQFQTSQQLQNFTNHQQLPSKNNKNSKLDEEISNLKDKQIQNQKIISQTSIPILKPDLQKTSIPKKKPPSNFNKNEIVILDSDDDNKKDIKEKKEEKQVTDKFTANLQDQLNNSIQNYNKNTTNNINNSSNYLKVQQKLKDYQKVQEPQEAIIIDDDDEVKLDQNQKNLQNSNYNNSNNKKIIENNTQQIIQIQNFDQNNTSKMSQQQVIENITDLQNKKISVNDSIKFNLLNNKNQEINSNSDQFLKNSISKLSKETQNNRNNKSDKNKDKNKNINSLNRSRSISNSSLVNLKSNKSQNSNQLSQKPIQGQSLNLTLNNKENNKENSNSIWQQDNQSVNLIDDEEDEIIEEQKKQQQQKIQHNSKIQREKQKRENAKKGFQIFNKINNKFIYEPNPETSTNIYNNLPLKRKQYPTLDKIVTKKIYKGQIFQTENYHKRKSPSFIQSDDQESQTTTNYQDKNQQEEEEYEEDIDDNTKQPQEIPNNIQEMITKVKESNPDLFFKTDKNDNLWLRCKDCKSKMMKVNYKEPSKILLLKKEKSSCKKCIILKNNSQTPIIINSKETPQQTPIKKQNNQELKKQKKEEEKRLLAEKKLQDQLLKQQQQKVLVQEKQQDIDLEADSKAQTMIGPDFQATIPVFQGNNYEILQKNQNFNLKRIKSQLVYEGSKQRSNYEDMLLEIKRILRKTHYSHSDFVTLMKRFQFKFDLIKELIKTDNKEFMQQILQSTGTNIRQTRHKNKRMSYIGNQNLSNSNI